jgi:hypothetical protein
VNCGYIVSGLRCMDLTAIRATELAAPELLRKQVRRHR